MYTYETNLMGILTRPKQKRIYKIESNSESD